jgi:hypothetical protein
MKECYELYLDEEKIKTFKTRKEAHSYIEKNYNNKLPEMNYEPLGVGDLEIWENDFLCIEIRRFSKGKVDVIGLLKGVRKSDIVKKRDIVEVNTTKYMPCTPKRTRIFTTGKLMEEANDGKIIEKDGKKYISKRGKDGKYRWNRYYTKNYQTGGRKSPKEAAKNFDNGIKMMGVDGSIWIVREQSNGVKKWFKN